MQGEGGQATVEWVALVLAAALLLGAAAALSGRETDRGLGEEVAKRIARTASEVGSAPGATQAPAGARPGPATGARPVPPPRASAPPGPRAVDAFRSLRGVAGVAKHAWIVCLGYRRWRYELEHPSAPNEALPVGVALSIVNDCLNPHDYLLED